MFKRKPCFFLRFFLPRLNSPVLLGSCDLFGNPVQAARGSEPGIYRRSGGFGMLEFDLLDTDESHESMV